MSLFFWTVNVVKRWILMAAVEAVMVEVMGMATVPAGAAEGQAQVTHCGWGQSITFYNTISISTVVSAMAGSTPSAWQPQSTWTEKDTSKSGRNWRWSRLPFGGEVQMETTITRPLSPSAWAHYSGDWTGGWTIPPFCRLLCAAIAARRHPLTQSSAVLVWSIRQTTRLLSTPRHWPSFTSSWDSTVRKQSLHTDTWVDLKIVESRKIWMLNLRLWEYHTLLLTIVFLVRKIRGESAKGRCHFQSV